MKRFLKISFMKICIWENIRIWKIERIWITKLVCCSEVRLRLVLRECLIFSQMRLAVLIKVVFIKKRVLQSFIFSLFVCTYSMCYILVIYVLCSQFSVPCDRKTIALGRALTSYHVKSSHIIPCRIMSCHALPLAFVALSPLIIVCSGRSRIFYISVSTSHSSGFFIIICYTSVMSI